jgi:formamidopyrimidine-DNA glycosylase
MPELAEVEYYRKLWDVGVGKRVLRVALHADKRPLRGIDAQAAAKALAGSTLLGSEAHAKQMLFRFGNRGKADAWLGIHLGMTGRISVERESFSPGRHDHLVLYQKGRALVFNDPRQFGRIRFDPGAKAPAWWTSLPPAIGSKEFSLDRLHGFLARRKSSTIKGLLLMQDFFPGVGNWMADEILWRARIHPRRHGGTLTPRESQTLWRETREVCRIALDTVGKDFSEPPDDWFFHVRWTAKGHCPRCGLTIQTGTIAGRTTRWCAKCQPARPAGSKGSK